MLDRRIPSRFLVACVLAGLTACAAPPPAPAPAPGPPSRGGASPGIAYEVVGSDIAIEVYRDGPLAGFGHNHVIASTGLGGRIELREPLSRSSFTLELPTAALKVDETARRQAAGDDFPDNLSADDKEGTRRNMLSPAVLDAGRFPVIRLKAAGIDGSGRSLLVAAHVTVAGAGGEIAVPVSVEVDGERLRAAGTFTLTHSQLGLKPFSALMGALRVREDMRMTWRLEARRVSGDS